MSHNSESLISGMNLPLSPQIMVAVVAGIVLLLVLFWKFKGGDSHSYSHSDDGGLLSKILKYGVILIPLAVLAARFAGFI